MPTVNEINVPAFFLAHDTSCASWANLSESERLRHALRYLYPGTFVDDGGTTPWERVPTPMYVQAAGFVGSVNAFCGNVQRQFPTIYLAQWPVYRIGRWNRPRWRWHGGPMGPMHGGPMPHFPGPGPFTH